MASVYGEGSGKETGKEVSKEISKETSEGSDESKTDVDWEHKFKVLQGKYNAEVPRLQKQLHNSENDSRELNQRMLNLESTLAAIRTVQNPEKSEKSKLPSITDEERAQFGDDLIDLIERTAARKILPEIDTRVGKLNGQVRQIDEKVAHTETSVAESKRQQVMGALAAAVPDWMQQNEDPRFLEWLDQEEGLSGLTRSHFLTEAMKSYDARGVTKYFTGFRNENTATAKKPALASDKKESKPQVRLDDFTAPGTPQTGVASAPNEDGKRVWTRNDIRDFYAQRNALVNKGRKIPQELLDLEKDLFLAQKENRIR